MTSDSHALYRRVLLDHERALLAAGALRDVTHPGATSIVLVADSADPAKCLAALRALPRSDLTLFAKRPELLSAGLEVVYRPVGDDELMHLLNYNQLPSTQPYQAIMESEPGRAYAERYVDGTKSVDTKPSTVVELLLPAALLRALFARQSKCEDGCMSTGLGAKAGNGVGAVNAWLAELQQCGRAVRARGADVDDEDDDDDDDDGDVSRQSASPTIHHQSSRAPDTPLWGAPEVEHATHCRGWRIVKVKRRLKPRV